MFIIKRRGKNVGGAHRIYSKTEAVEAGITPVSDWRKAQTGDWVLTDDGWVGQVLHHKDYIDRRRSRNAGHDVYTRFLWFAFGKVTSYSKGLDLRKLMVTQYKINGVPWQKEFLRRKRGEMFVVTWCLMMINDGKVDYKILGNLIGSGKNPEYRAKMYIRNPRIKNILDETMKKLLQDKGITREQVIEDLTEIKNKAIKDKKYKEALDVIGRFEKYLGMEGDDSGLPQAPDDETRSIADRFDEFSQPEQLGRYESGMDGDRLLLGDPNQHKAEVTDEDGYPIRELGRGDE